MWPSLPERGHIGHVCGPWDGKQGPGLGFPTQPTGDPIFIFGVPKRVFSMKHLQGPHFSIARDLRAVVGDRLRTSYHMPYAHASYLRIPADSCGVSPNRLETGRI